MQPALIIVLCVSSAILYGVVHDQITARVCVEYFTVGHDSNVFPTTDPTLLGLGWGIISTWWVGLILGLALVVAARFGRRSPRSARSLVRPVIILMIAAGAFAFGAGLLGHALTRTGGIQLAPQVAEKLPADRHALFAACLFAHTASYAVGFVGGGMQIALVWASRRWLPAK